MPVGQPKILAASSATFRTGSIGLIKATIQNTGTATGSFSVAATCQAPFSSNDRSTVSLGAGQQTDVYLQMMCQANQLTQGQCSVSTSDVNNPANADSRLVATSCDVIAECREGVKDATGQLLRQCIDGRWKVLQTCPSGQYAEPITFSCKDNTIPGGGGPGGGPNPPGSGGNLDWLAYLFLAGVLALGAAVIIKKRSK